MSDHNTSSTRPKLTKGEKCILAHLTLTIIIILILLTVYIAHICVVSHTDSKSVFDTRRTGLSANADLNKFPIGLIYLNISPIRKICNTLLLTEEWSISPAHCVAIRSEPDLAYLLFTWSIMYSQDDGVKIKRGIIHPNFNRDIFTNNVGLLQHMPVPGFRNYKIPNIKAIDNFYQDDNNINQLAVVSWDHEPISDDMPIEIMLRSVQVMSHENCTSFVGAITELRSYEFCVVLESRLYTMLGHGALAIDINDLTAYGAFSWGERQQMFLPLIILDLSHFKQWIDSVLPLNTKI